MESYKIENLTFKYPTAESPALDDISLTVHEGEFLCICGKSGCGKSTLLRMLKPTLTPFGEKSGTIYFMGKSVSDMDFREESEKIGFVYQNPDNQIVTDKVWHELAFGLESLGVKSAEIRARVAEMASFFGIQTWFHKDVAELSGGQKQLLNLASVMVMQPSVLILDEPTSRLDPIAAQDFLEIVFKINRELGTTVILAEHRLEEAFAISDRIVVMVKGKIVAQDEPRKIGNKLKEMQNDMFAALPTAVRVHASVDKSGVCPMTVREGRDWLTDLSEKIKFNPIKDRARYSGSERIIELKDVWFRYEKNLPDVLKGLSTEIYKGELYAIMGGNGTGKTTALSVISGLNKPYRGEVLINGKGIDSIHGVYDGLIGVLPQDPQALFVKKTVLLDLYEMLSDRKMSKEEKERTLREVVEICELEELLERHPYDLSGGEQQRAALAKVLMLKPKILLLDEPTKGLGAHFKKSMAGILTVLKSAGVTIVMVSHDIEFCAKYADRCAMFFDGNIVSESRPEEFFSGKSFYTTAANRMARHLLPNAVLAEDIILACGGETDENEYVKKSDLYIEKKEDEPLEKKGKSFTKAIFGIAFAVLFLLCIYLNDKVDAVKNNLVQLLSILFLGLSLSFLLPKKILDDKQIDVQTPKAERKLTKRTLIGVAMILLAVPLTIYMGVYFFGDRKYYFISLLIIIETMLPFAFVFESRKPQARELVVISVLCAIVVAGRAAFYTLPQFKPIMAIVIIAGVCFGGETGFLVGAVSGFVSNFFFAQGPWTPWQMFALGMVGFVAGILFKKGFLRKTRGSLCVFGGIATLVIYGGIMNPASVIMAANKITLEMIISGYVTGFPFDLIHAASTVFFLWIAAPAMIEKLERIKVKYGVYR